MAKKIGLLALLLFAVSAQGDGGWWAFLPQQYYDPLIAGVREPHLSALALARADRMAFMVKKDSPRFVWDIDAGGEIPIVGWQKGSLGNQMNAGDFGIGLWIPIDLHMIEDFADNSAPIVNTDYRFGGMIKARYAITSTRHVAARLHIGHESSHLGDEFSIVGQNVHARSFERINVSWEYVDLGVMYERVRRYSVRGGITATLPFQTSYYFTDPESITSSPRGEVTPSKNWFDPYLGVEWTRPGFIRTRNKPYDLYASGELRWRSIYDYHKLSADASEDRQASINLIVGIKKAGDAGGFGRASPFVRFYRGVNPHGQFRNQKDFTEMGIGLRLVR